MALIGEMHYLTIGGKTYSLPSGDEGSVTSVGVSNATNGGLTISGSPVTSSGTISIGHSNVLTSAQTTQAVYPIKIDKNGHISEYGSAVSIPDVSGKVDKSGDTMSGDLTFNNKDIIFKYPTNGTYEVKFGIKGYNGISSNYTPKAGFNKSTILQNINTPEQNTDGANKKYVDDSISALSIPTKVSDLTNDAGYITAYTETDPIFSASAASGITSTDINNWNAKVSDDHKWGGVALGSGRFDSTDDIWVPSKSNNDGTSGTAYWIRTTQELPTSSAVGSVQIPRYKRIGDLWYLQSTTPSANDNSTKVATTAYVDSAVPINISDLTDDMVYDLGTVVPDSDAGTFQLSSSQTAEIEDMWDRGFCALTLTVGNESYYAFKEDIINYSGIDVLGFVGSEAHLDGANMPLCSTILVGISEYNIGIFAKVRSLTEDDMITAISTQVPSWALNLTKPSYTFSEIGSKPTTISGYGITDAYTKTEVDNKISAVLRYKGVKATISALPSSGNVTGDVWHVTEDGGEYAWDGSDWQELGKSIDLSNYATKATTLSGYGITDANITNGTITLGGNTITPLTSFTETDPVFSASAAAGITSTDVSNWNAKVSDDKTWNGVTLEKSGDSGSSSDYYTIYAAGTGPSTAKFITVTSTPSAYKVAKYGQGAYLYSTTPSTNDNSTKAATTAYVDRAVGGITVPTKVSDLTNDAGYIAEDSNGDISITRHVILGGNVQADGDLLCNGQITAAGCLEATGILIYTSAGTVNAIGPAQDVTSDWSYYLPSKNGTLATLEDIPSIPTIPSITLNGSTTTSPSFYAPTSAGTSGNYLKSNGSGAPTWASFPTIPSITLNGSSTMSPSFYAPTGVGTSGQYLKSNGSGAPSWANFPTIPSITLNGSSSTSPSFYAPTSAGTSGYYLKSNGSGAPTWASFPTIPVVPSNIVNTITTTAGAHSAITNQTGNVSFNVPTTADHVGAVPDCTIGMYNGNAGNPNPIRFLEVNYTSANSENGVLIKFTMRCGHGNGMSYNFLQDVIVSVGYTGTVSVDTYRYYAQSISYDGTTHYYGDIFYTIDTTNKIVTFYVLMGQYSTVYSSPNKRMNSSSGGTITQYTSATKYSSGTKTYGNVIWLDGREKTAVQIVRW